MKTAAEVHWIEGIGFETHVRDHHQLMDGKKEFGGKDRGPNPKEYVLAGLCGCTGMDVVSLLKKFKATFDSFDVSAESELSKNHPVIFTEIHLTFKIEAVGIDPEYFKKAVTLSMTRYCGVSAMLSKAVPISYKLLLNDQFILNGIAQFDDVNP